MTFFAGGNETTPKEFEHNFEACISANFFVIVLLFNDVDRKYLPKLKTEKIKYLYVRQKKFKRSYVYIMGHKTEFMDKKEEIIKQLEILNERNKIYGARFFKEIQPSFD